MHYCIFIWVMSMNSTHRSHSIDSWSKKKEAEEGPELDSTRLNKQTTKARRRKEKYLLFTASVSLLQGYIKQVICRDI